MMHQRRGFSNNYRAPRLILILMLMLSAFFAEAQVYQKNPARYQFRAGIFDSTFRIPRGASPQLNENILTTIPGALFYNMTDSNVYVYNGSDWDLVGGNTAFLWGSMLGDINDQADLIAKFNTYQPLMLTGTVSQYRRGNHTLGNFDSAVRVAGDSRYSLLTHTHIASHITDLTTAVRNMFSQGAGISYNPTTGVISAIDTTSGGSNQYVFNLPLSETNDTVSISQANSTDNGFLSSVDWNTFNNKIGPGDTSAMLNDYQHWLEGYIKFSDSLFYTTRWRHQHSIDSLAALISGSITANNGLTMSTSTNVQLGGSALQNTSITWGNYSFSHTFNSLVGNGLNLSTTSTVANDQRIINIALSGANGSSAMRSSGIYIDNSHSGTNPENYGVYSTITNGISSSAALKGIASSNQYGVHGSSTSGIGVGGAAPTGIGVSGVASSTGIGVSATSISGTGMQAISTNSIAGLLQVNPTSTNTVAEIMRISRMSSGTAADGIGGTIDYYIKNAGGSAMLSSRLISKLTNSSGTVGVSQFEIWSVNAGVQQKDVSLGGGTYAAEVHGNTKLDGAVYHKFTAVPDANYTILSSDYLIELAAPTTLRTLTLPNPGSHTGRMLKIRNENAGTNWEFSSSVRLVNGTTVTTIPAERQMELYSNGTEWKMFH